MDRIDFSKAREKVLPSLNHPVLHWVGWRQSTYSLV